MSDLISRQDAKDAIDMALDHIDHVPPWVYDKLLNALNEVPSAEKTQLSEEDATFDIPSAEPKTPSNGSITCVKPEKMHDRTMGDCISRKDAIEAVDSETVSTNPEHFKSSEKFIKFMDDVDIASFGKWKWANGFNTALVATRVQLKKLPSAEPERKKGEWIRTRTMEHDGELYCDQCEQEHPEQKIIWNFCTNCGADMRSKEEHTMEEFMYGQDMDNPEDGSL